MFLDNHINQYNFSYNDAALTLATGFSGVTYSLRHWELSERSSSGCSSFAHRAIALVEALPLFGGIVALIEKVAFCVKEFFTQLYSSPLQTALDQEFIEVLINDEGLLATSNSTSETNAPNLQRVPSWRNSSLDTDTAFRKMVKNTVKAILEHSKKDSSSIATFKSISPFLSYNPEAVKTPISTSFFATESQGKRSEMEDVIFFEENKDWALAGILDGHGGKEVATFISQNFTEYFFAALEELEGNVHQAFEITFDRLQSEVEKNEFARQTGCTATICFIDKVTHRIYTANLGDSEANIYRTIKDEKKSIPLSCVRDWSSLSDAKRASLALSSPRIAESWPKAENPKRLRYPNPLIGINVSRAFGDMQYAGTKETPAVIHKPKITVNTLMPGDVLVLACDGLKEVALEKEIINEIDKVGVEGLSNHLVDFAITEQGSSDNVSVAVIEIS